MSKRKCGFLFRHSNMTQIWSISQPAYNIYTCVILLLQHCYLLSPTPSCLYSLLWLKLTQSLSLSVCGHFKQMATGKKAETTHPDYVNTSVPASNWMLMLWSEMLIVSCAICWNTGELHCGMENWKLVCRRCLSQQGPLIAEKTDRCSLRAWLWSSCWFPKSPSGVTAFVSPVVKMLKRWFCIKGLKEFRWKTWSNWSSQITPGFDAACLF